MPCCVCSQLFATPWTIAHQTPLSMGYNRQQYQSGLPFPSLGDLPDPGIEPASLASPALAGGFFTTNATCKAQALFQGYKLVQPLRSTVWKFKFLKRLKIELPYDPEILLLSKAWKEMKSDPEGRSARPGSFQLHLPSPGISPGVLHSHPALVFQYSLSTHTCFAWKPCFF